MSIVEATRRYEAWLRRRIPVVEEDLDYKHEQMRADPFLFFRATYYRWAQLWKQNCPQLARAPEVYAVGDLHLENFGTWRDAEGRLVWGVNDFDEAHPMAFPNDLVRLAVSALLAAESSYHFRLKPGEMRPARRGIPRWDRTARRAVCPHGVAPEATPHGAAGPASARCFLGTVRGEIAAARGIAADSVRKAFAKILPEGATPEYRILKSPKGLGSLGRRRYLALANWQGGRIAREAKAVVASANLWANGQGDRAGKGNPWLERIVESAVRCADPYYEVRGGWLVRRLGPDCSRIDIDELVHHEEMAELLFSMGQETANIHLGTPKGRKRVRRAAGLAALSKKGRGAGRLPSRWLEKAAQLMLKLSLKDWHQFRDAKNSALR